MVSKRIRRNIQSGTITLRSKMEVRPVTTHVLHSTIFKPHNKGLLMGEIELTALCCSHEAILVHMSIA